MASTPKAVKEMFVKKSADYQAGRNQTYSVLEASNKIKRYLLVHSVGALLKMDYTGRLRLKGAH